MAFYEFSARPVNLGQMESLTQSFHQWMKHVSRISWETNYDDPNIMQVLVYVEDDSPITVNELNYISQWFLDNNLTFYIVHKMSN